MMKYSSPIEVVALQCQKPDSVISLKSTTRETESTKEAVQAWLVMQYEYGSLMRKA